MTSPNSKLLAGVAIAALVVAVPAFAQSSNDPAASGTAGNATNSGPGVQGPPDTRTGPSTKGSEGMSSGESSTENTTTPSQDSSGVAGAPGNKNSPAAKPPSNPAAADQNKMKQNN
jgi:hypothetical protein